MPPKKQQEEAVPAGPCWTILPIVMNSELVIETLKKSVTIKKTLDRAKLIELLKEKGIDKYLNEQQQLTRQGELFLCENMQATAQQFLTQARKPVDPKKDQKKDTKKDSKKEEVVVQQGQKPIQFDFQKSVSQFLFLLDIPTDAQALNTALNNGLKPQVIVCIEQRIKQGSELPNYDLLNNNKTIQDFMNEMNKITPDARHEQRPDKEYSSAKLQNADALKTIKQWRMKADSPIQQTIIIEVPFEKDLQHPQQDVQQFLSTLFKRLCQLSLQKIEYENWSKVQKKVSMVPPIKETIKKQVVVEQKKEDKKGGKKDAGPPVTEIIQEVVQKKYESFLQNIKSDLSLYRMIAKQRPREKKVSQYYKILDDLAYAVSSSTESTPKLSNIKDIGSLLWSKHKSKPISKITVSNLGARLPSVSPSLTSNELNFSFSLVTTEISTQVGLSNIVKAHPFETQLQYEYKLQQFTQLSKNAQSRSFPVTFENRKYVQKLTTEELNTRINQQLQHDPKVYFGQCKEDNYKLLILTRYNPPGRTLYYNRVFDWKVVPNFQLWTQAFANKEQKQQQFEFFDYDWRGAGNLKILSKKMMPTDNTIITQNVLSCGDHEKRLITLSKDNIRYGLQELKNKEHLFWKHQHDLRTNIYTKKTIQSENQRINVQTCVQRKQFTVVFNPHPTVYWHQDPVQLSRTFGPEGQITKRMKNGNTQIMYPNGDLSILSFGKWTHIKGNKRITGTLQEKQMKLEEKVDTDKRVFLREDSTAFIMHPSGKNTVAFYDGTVLYRKAKNIIQILNKQGLIIRISLKRDKDFNIIGTGSAFAYLGFTNILQRSYDGSLYQLYHPSFSWHSYCEGIERDNKISQEPVFLLAYPDKSFIRIQNALQRVTFLNSCQDNSQSSLEERWIQMFTARQYHGEGVYDVDLKQGQIRTKDAESNLFQVRVDGTGKNSIAVSFNIGQKKQEKNITEQGFHVPQENFFLPPPNNGITPKLLIVYPDGNGQQYLTQEQINDLKNWKAVTQQVTNRTITQYCQEVTPISSYIQHSFSPNINLSSFQLPNLISNIDVRPSNIAYNYAPILFRSLEHIEWDHHFENVKRVRNEIKEKRRKLKEQIDGLRNRGKQ